MMWSALVLHQLISLRLVTIGVSLCLEDSLQTAFFFTRIYYGATRWRRDGERASLDWRRGGNCRRHGRLGASR